MTEMDDFGADVDTPESLANWERHFPPAQFKGRCWSEGGASPKSGDDWDNHLVRCRTKKDKDRLLTKVMDEMPRFTKFTSGTPTSLNITVNKEQAEELGMDVNEFYASVYGYLQTQFNERYYGLVLPKRGGD
jgi:hypothetical protein